MLIIGNDERWKYICYLIFAGKQCFSVVQSRFYLNSIQKRANKQTEIKKKIISPIGFNYKPAPVEASSTGRKLKFHSNQTEQPTSARH